MKRTVLFLWLIALFVWAGMKFGGRVWFVEKFHRHHCKLEWIQTGTFEEYHLICSETGRSLGEVMHRDGLWNAFSVECSFILNENFTSKEQAIKAVEKCQ